MYSLASGAGTGKGGGTSVEPIVAAADRLVRTHGRRVKSIKSRITSRNIAHYVDSGLPVMWSMYVDPKLNKDLTRRAAARRQSQDMNQWEETLQPLRKAARKLSVNRDRGHVCMIIGYNHDTYEIAISDSWGPAFQERWLTIEEASAISQDELLVIRW